MWWRDAKSARTSEQYFCEECQPLGFVDQDAAAFGHGEGSRLARALAVFAQLEQAAAMAQTELYRALRSAGGPEFMLRRCRQATEDERVHAAVLGGLAQAQGAEVPRVILEPAECSDVAVFRQHAVWGCVNAAFAAVMADLSAHRASTAELRRVYRSIADDEIRHAELAWDVHRWVYLHAKEKERRVLADLQGRAMASLPSRVVAMAHRVPQALGRPRGETLRALASRFAETLHARTAGIERQIEPEATDGPAISSRGDELSRLADVG